MKSTKKVDSLVVKISYKMTTSRLKLKIITFSQVCAVEKMQTMNIFSTHVHSEVKMFSPGLFIAPSTSSDQKSISSASPDCI